MNRILLLLLLLTFLFFNSSYAQMIDPIAQPFPGQHSVWKGFNRYDFEISGKQAHAILPTHALAGKPWIWRARFPDWHTEMDSILLSEGFHVVFINTNNQYGSPKAMNIWDEFYDYLTENYAFNSKVTLEGVSRGGLFIYAWAKRHPLLVNCIYAEAPVCDFLSWPGGLGKGKGSKEDWERLKTEYGFRTDEDAKAWNDLSIDNLDKLAETKVPVLHIIGLNDRVVPPEENTYKLIDRYVKLGGPATIIPCTLGKQDLEGHHFTIETPRLGADFIKYHTSLPQQLLNASGYHNIRNGIRNSLIKFSRDKKGCVAFLGGSITYNGGWRDSICNYLQTRFPETEFEFIAAGIPSMGTTPAAFRLERDVLSKGPIDLLFEEAAVNDATNGRRDEEQIRGMEGIVRHLRSQNPSVDIVIMHFVDPDKIESYRTGLVPQVILNHEKVAAHYDIPTINLAREVTDRIHAGEFTWEDDFINLHPSPFGQQIYFLSIKAFLEKAWGGYVAEDDNLKNYIVPSPLDKNNYDAGALVDVEEVKLGKGWQVVDDWKPLDGMGTRANYVNVPMLVGTPSGKNATFRFYGNAVGIAVAAGPDAGIIEYSIDGGSWQKQDMFTHWSSHLHLPWYYTLATGLRNKAHTLRIRLSSEKNPESTGNVCRIRYFYVNNSTIKH